MVHTGTVHAHTTGFTVQVKGLIRDERRLHITPCKGPLSPFLLQWSVKLWETNDLRATVLCATAKEKEGGGRSCFVGGPASLLSSLSYNDIPTMPFLCAARRCFSCLQLLQQPSQPQNCNLSRESKTPFPHRNKGVSHLAAWLVIPAYWLKECSRPPVFDMYFLYH